MRPFSTSGVLQVSPSVRVVHTVHTPRDQPSSHVRTSKASGPRRRHHKSTLFCVLVAYFFGFLLPGTKSGSHGLVHVFSSVYCPPVDFLLYRRQRRVGAASALPRPHQGGVPPVPGPFAPAPRHRPLQRLCPPPPGQCPVPGPGAAWRSADVPHLHAPPPGKRVRAVRDNALPDGGGAEHGRSAVPRAAGRRLRAGCHAARHPAQSLHADERRARALGQGAPPRQGKREEAQLQSAGVHFRLLPGPRQRPADQGGRAARVQIILSTGVVPACPTLSEIHLLLKKASLLRKESNPISSTIRHSQNLGKLLEKQPRCE